MNPASWNTFYPRPQLRRDSFLPLSGGWLLDGSPVTVPWPPQAPLSGYGHPVGNRLRYEARFSLPPGFLPPGSRLRLNFGAVDQRCEAYVNGAPAGSHEGGYLPFSMDITDALAPEGNILRLDAEDALSRDYPYGKQSARPHGMWYTPVSGIWQPVWLEAVPEEGAIRSLRLTPDLRGVTVEAETDAPAFSVEVPLDGGAMLRAEGRGSVRLDVPSPRLWSTGSPFLYPLTVRTATDTVHSYFALREMRVAREGGFSRFLLNGQPVFLHGVLDQGYFPGGIYLPGTPAEYERDVLRMKELGFNMLRKHIKVEPEAFYYYCDLHGMLVLQDMVNSGGYSWLRDTVVPNFITKRRHEQAGSGTRRQAFFESHARQTQDALYSHPCVIGYTIFNEGWGQFDSDRLYRECRARDPSRFYDSTSGWFAQRESDVQSEHRYFTEKILRAREPGKALLLSECGGYTRAVPGHCPEGRGYGYGRARSREELTERVRRLYRDMVLASIPCGLCGSVYTQLCDVEGEINGLYTYDRQICKVDGDAMRQIAREVHAAAGRAAGR